MYILAIEVIVLQVLVMWLTYHEFNIEPIEELYKDLDKEYLALKPRKKGGLQVRNVFEEVENVDEQHLVRIEKTLFPRESHLRKLVL